MANVQILSPKDIAIETGRDSKSVRAMMRRMTDADNQPGSGGRWVIESGSEFHTELVKRLTAVHNRATVTATLKD
jgi:hypothetical protein